MKKLQLLVTVLVILCCAVACDDRNQDLTNQVNHNGSVETSVTVQHIDSLHDVLVTKHQVWVSGQTFKTLEYKDTIPALGIENAKAENSDGDTQAVNVKKDYEIFITVK
jgi:uncharacterized lipoprotein YehR (DUF1307 family)